MRTSLNAWIGSSTFFDGIIDLDAMMRDPEHSASFRPGLDTDKKFGPNVAGEQIIAEAINIELLR